MSVQISDILNKKTWYIILGLLVLETLSFLGFLYPIVRELSFWLILLLVLYFTLKDLRFGVMAGILELIVGSQGHILYSLGISLRIGLWLIVVGVWFFKWLLERRDYLKQPKRERGYENLFYHNRYLGAFVLLWLFAILGAVIGYFKADSLQTWFLDFNAWLYFLWIFPAMSLFYKKSPAKTVKNLSLVAAAGLLWIAIKSLVLLFIFSHGWQEVFTPLYHWSRQNYLGEITYLEGGFYRIFFQSQIYALLALSLSWLGFNNFSKLNKKNKVIQMTLASLFMAVVLISFSRSFWLGAIIGFVAWAVLTLVRHNWSKLFSGVFKIILSTIIAVFLITLVAQFPLPGSNGAFSTGKLLKSRADITNSDEAAISSRWSLLPVLLKEVAKNPILGQGFGAEVTYQTNDPRVLENNEEGYYQAYAFEWGWLDIWLKIGLFGLLAYIWLLYNLIKDGLQAHNFQPQATALGVSVLVLAAVNMFTPYLNHPLAIGYLIIVSLVIAKSKDREIKKV